MRVSVSSPELLPYYVPTPLEQRAMEAHSQGRADVFVQLMKHVYYNQPERRKAAHYFMSLSCCFDMARYPRNPESDARIDRLHAHVMREKEKRRAQIVLPPPYQA